MVVKKNSAKTVKSSAQTLVAKKLALILSDTYVLAVKTHGYHWNVMGPTFVPLHAFFGEQYEALVDAADEIAERIRSLGLMPDGSMDSFLQNTAIKEAGPKPLTSRQMLEDLLESHAILKKRLIEAENVADDADDIVTQDFLVGRLAYHEKIMWMIRSLIA